jgi:diguanylate cyclase (GGDEF)-like protein
MTFPVYYLSTALNSCVVFILLFINYLSKYNTDNFQRKLFLFITSAAFVATLADFSNRAIAGMEGMAITRSLYALVVLFYAAQNTTYYVLIVFIDYFAHNSIERAKKGLRVIGVFLAVYVVFAVATLPKHLFFSISPDNRYVPGQLYIVRLVISYLPMVIITVNSLLSLKRFTRAQVYMIILIGIINGGGGAADVLLGTGSLTWPCFAAAMLFIYFFIVQNDTKIDALTEIGNRGAFTEFMSALARQSTKQAYSIAMIDMDHFKYINDAYGHAVGDRALREMAQIIKDCIRHSDFAARFGGDEFVIAIKAQYDMGRLMERIEETIDVQNENAMRPYLIEISYGYDTFVTHSGSKIDEFLAHIDQLMYEHKAARHEQDSKKT